MNIWYISAYDQPKGHSSRVYDFCLELLRRGHEVTFFTNSYNHWTHFEKLEKKEKWRIEETDGIRVVWLKTFPYSGNGINRGINMISNMLRIFQVTRVLDDQPDVVIGPSVPIGTGWAALKISQKKSAAFVYEVRDVWPIALVDDGGLSKYNPIYFLFRAMEKTLYKKSNRISSTLPYIFEHVKESGGNPQNVRWIPNGVDIQRFCGYDNYNGGNGSTFVVMYVGGFGMAHDAITIIRAANILQNLGYSEFRFVLVGDGFKRKKCEAEALTFNLKNIEFRNPVPKADIPKLQAESDILLACIINSDIYRFGFNLNKLYDYFASGRPVVLSVKSQKNPVVESGAGFSIPPENPYLLAESLIALRRMSSQQRVDIGKKGQRFVQNNFSIDQLGNIMELTLDESVKSKGLRNLSRKKNT